MKDWWKEAIFYEIYMPSFCDGNGDGIGDFKGIASKLAYLKELDIDAIWLTPFYKSPKIDNGYDISDYYSIDADYGTMYDFQVFLDQAHQRGIKVIADLVLNHTSSLHPWFLESRESRTSPKRDWYIWKDKVEGHQPNNWESYFGGSAWEYDEKTAQYYYHAFAKEQVDLNWYNPEVKNAMFDVIRFWLDKGIDGFRLDVINFLGIDPTLQNNPYDEEGKQIHLHDKDLPIAFEIVEELRTLVNKYEDKVLVGEVGTEEFEIAKTYAGQDKLDLIFNFNLGSIQKFEVKRIFDELKKMEKENQGLYLPTLFFSSHDMPRHITRLVDQDTEQTRAQMLCTLMLTATGVPFLYYGEEIGMTDLYVDDISEMRDVQGILTYQRMIAEGNSVIEALEASNMCSRDKSRSPIQWNDTVYAGFSQIKPWICVNENYTKINVECQSREVDSMLQYYKNMIRIRKKYKALYKGNYELLDRRNDVLFFIRKYKEQRIGVFFNFGIKQDTLHLESLSI